MGYIHRKDQRTDDKFAKQIKASTERENLWAEILLLELDSLFEVDVSFSNYGYGSDGDVITTKVTAKPDKIYDCGVGNPIAIEIKTYNYARSKFDMATFKVSSLEACVEYNAFIAIPSATWWALINSEGCEYILNNYTHKIYDNFSPNDNAIRIYDKDIKKIKSLGFLKVEKWKDSRAKYNITTHYDKLFSK